MRTILLSIAMMGAALTADAQATVKVNFNKNDTTMYKEVVKMYLRWLLICLWDREARA